ncbi:MAG: beta-ketoacyl synthase N-terminal-like domain-containing protein [Fuerstiella sp.]
MISGFGAVSGFGLSADDLWTALCGNQQAVKPLTSDQIDHWSQLTQFLQRVPSAAVVDRTLVFESLQNKLGRHAIGQSVVKQFGFDLVNSMAMLALVEAVEDAGFSLQEIRSLNVGCVVGTSKPSLRAVEDWFLETTNSDRGLPNRSLPNVDTFESAFLPDSCQRACSRLLNVTGPGYCPVAACATGMIAVLQGAMLIQRGVVDLCVVGSSDASARASVMAAFHRLGVLSRHENPSSGCRPFDLNRDGFHIGEGAGMLVLESARHAAARGQSTDVRLTRGAWLTDATGLTQIDSTGSMVHQILEQMEDGTATHLCSLHGTGTVPNDQCEAQGLQQHFGALMPPSFGIKGATGHLLGAAGSVELGIAIRAMQQGVILATTNHVSADPQCPLSIKTELQANQSIRSLTKLSLGFGGHVVGCRAELTN